MAKTGGPADYESRVAQIRLANQWGREFEEDVRNACKFYREKGLARLYKAPPPPRGTTTSNVGGVAPVDFTGRLCDDRNGKGQGAGTRVAFECKHITRTATWKFDDNRMSQAHFLARIKKHGGIAFVLFGDRTLNKVWLCASVEQLAKGMHVNVRNVVDGEVLSQLPEVPYVDVVLDGKPVRIPDFLPVALKYCVSGG